MVDFPHINCFAASIMYKLPNIFWENVNVIKFFCDQVLKVWIL